MTLKQIIWNSVEMKTIGYASAGVCNARHRAFHKCRRKGLSTAKPLNCSGGLGVLEVNVPARREGKVL